jgi:agmatinase
MEGLAPLNTVAMDCMEVAPAYDHAELTTNAAATAVWTYLSGQTAKYLLAQPQQAIEMDPKRRLPGMQP